MLYIRDSFWSGQMYVEDFDLRRGLGCGCDGWGTELEDFVLESAKGGCEVAEAAGLTSGDGLLGRSDEECKKLL